MSTATSTNVPATSNRLRLIALATLISVAVLARLMPHPPNFSPLGAIALFGGACLADRRLSMLMPFAILFISDLFLGLHALMPVIYGSFAVNVLLGWWLRSRRTVISTAVVTLIGSIQFFVVSNTAYWLLNYPITTTGFVECFVAAIPFFQNSLLGDFVFATAMFGGLAAIERAYPILREPTRVSIPV